MAWRVQRRPADGTRWRKVFCGSADASVDHYGRIARSLALGESVRLLDDDGFAVRAYTSLPPWRPAT